MNPGKVFSSSSSLRRIVENVFSQWVSVNLLLCVHVRPNRICISCIFPGSGRGNERPERTARLAQQTRSADPVQPQRESAEPRAARGQTESHQPLLEQGEHHFLSAPPSAPPTCHAHPSLPPQVTNDLLDRVGEVEANLQSHAQFRDKLNCLTDWVVITHQTILTRGLNQSQAQVSSQLAGAPCCQSLLILHGSLIERPSAQRSGSSVLPAFRPECLQSVFKFPSIPTSDQRPLSLD